MVRNTGPQLLYRVCRESAKDTMILTFWPVENIIVLTTLMLEYGNWIIILPRFELWDNAMMLTGAIRVALALSKHCM